MEAPSYEVLSGEDGLFGGGGAAEDELELFGRGFLAGDELLRNGVLRSTRPIHVADEGENVWLTLLFLEGAGRVQLAHIIGVVAP